MLLGELELLVIGGSISLQVAFTVVDEPSSFNSILGRTWLHAMQVVPSTYHQTLSFFTGWGQTDIWGDQLATRECCTVDVECAKVEAK